MGPERRRRPGVFAYRTNDAQLVVCNIVVVDFAVFAVFTDIVVLGCIVGSAWQGFQLGITAIMLECWLQASKLLETVSVEPHAHAWS